MTPRGHAPFWGLPPPPSPAPRKTTKTEFISGINLGKKLSRMSQRKGHFHCRGRRRSPWAVRPVRQEMQQVQPVLLHSLTSSVPSQHETLHTHAPLQQHMAKMQAQHAQHLQQQQQQQQVPQKYRHVRAHMCLHERAHGYKRLARTARAHAHTCTCTHRTCTHGTCTHRSAARSHGDATPSIRGPPQHA